MQYFSHFWFRGASLRVAASAWVALGGDIPVIGNPWLKILNIGGKRKYVG